MALSTLLSLALLAPAAGAAAPAAPSPSASAPAPATPEFKPGLTLGMAFQFLTIDYVGASPVAGAYPIGWNRVLFLPSGQATPTLGFKSRFAIDNFGVSSAGLGTGHIRTSSLDVGSPFYVDWAYATWKPEEQSVSVGLLMLNQEMKLGSTLPNPFDAGAVYSIGLTRYGGVGTPPLTAGGTLDAADTRPGDWLMGTNVSLETLDPNSTFVNFPAPALAAVYKRQLGDTQIAIGTMDGTSGVSLARAHDPAIAKTLYLPANYPETAAQRRGYSVAAVDHKLGPLRLQAAMRADNATFGTLAGKSSALMVEGGDGKLSASVTLAGAGAPVDTLGGYIWSNDALGSGWGAGLGLKARGMAFLRQGPNAFLSAGPVVKSPAFGFVPAFTLAAQQAQGPGGGALASGLTLETSVRPAPGLPLIHLELSSGKFNPSGDNGLLNFAAPFTHTLYSVITTLAF